MGKVKDLSIWRAHSYFIFERNIHSILFSGCPTEIVRLHLAKGFLGLVLNKSLKPYCQSVTNTETKNRPSIQRPNQWAEEKLTVFTWGKSRRTYHMQSVQEAQRKGLSWFHNTQNFQPGEAGNTDGKKRLTDVRKVLLVTRPKKDLLSI